MITNIIETSNTIELEHVEGFNEFTDYVMKQIKNHYQRMNKICEYAIESYSVNPINIQVTGYIVLKEEDKNNES